MVNGHALAVGDLNGDGRDEIVAGFRGKFQLYIFSADDDIGERWTRHILDPGGIAAADCKIADFVGNGRPAVACSASSGRKLQVVHSNPEVTLGLTRRDGVPRYTLGAPWMSNSITVAILSGAAVPHLDGGLRFPRGHGQRFSGCQQSRGRAAARRQR